MMLTSTTTRVTVRLPTLARTFRKTGGRTVSTVTRASSTETVRSDTRRDADPARQARASVDAPRAAHDPRLASRRARPRGGRRRAFRVSLSSRDTIRLRRSFSFVREVGSRPLPSRLPPSPGRTGRQRGHRHAAANARPSGSSRRHAPRSPAWRPRSDEPQPPLALRGQPDEPPLRHGVRDATHDERHVSSLVPSPFPRRVRSIRASPASPLHSPLRPPSSFRPSRAREHARRRLRTSRHRRPHPR